ncbi:MAG: AzlC family ABC transporter permease [Deltaproteobacteria bacterium]|jgi:4-azaleucine resistance transporter AzlC|nr:AzlC family ABC transporter permease [Deltaproteobacteria bacterium]
MIDMAPLRSGARLALPVVCGYLPVGFAFGVLAVHNGIAPWLAVFMSFVVYAGSSQLIAAGLIGAGAPVLSVVVTTFVVNLRHLLMSTALAPWLSRAPRPQLILFGFELTDETFALHSQKQRLGQPPIMAELIACNAIAQSGWIASTALGAFSGELLGDTRPFGLDFTLAAMFIALLAPQCRDRPRLFAAIAAAGLSVALTLIGADRWAVVIATVTAACLAGWLSWQRTGKQAKNAA